MNQTSRFHSVLNALSEKFYTFEEFPNISRSRLPAKVCEAAMAVGEEELADYSATLSGKELEAMILDFPALKTEAEWERIASVLMLRFSPRIIRLIFHLFQENCHSEAVWFLVKKVDAEADRRRHYTNEGVFIWDFGKSDDLFRDIRNAFYASTRELDDFFETYLIGEDTALAIEIRRQCLEGAEHSLILKNTHHMVYLIEKAPSEFLFHMITNYLQRFDVLNSSDEVNQAILKCLGEPSRAGNWEGFSDETKQRFSQWCFCYHLKLHSKKFPKKYLTLRQYYEQVKGCYELDEAPEALVVEFETIVIVDVADRPYSCFYHKNDFEKEIGECTEFGILPSFLREDGVQITARDHIIEEKNGPCIQLRYDGVGPLYIKSCWIETSNPRPTCVKGNQNNRRNLR